MKVIRSILGKLRTQERRRLASNGPAFFDDERYFSEEDLARVRRAVEADMGQSGMETSELFELLDARGDEIVGSMIAGAADMLDDRRRIRIRYRKHLLAIWGEAFDHLRMVLEAASEAGEEFNRQYQTEAGSSEDFQFDALRRLHARSCLLGNEVLWLMEGGFASAAMARWRTLHETAVVALFLAGRDQEVAERYLLHEVVDTAAAAKQYQVYAERNNHVPLTDAELQELERHRDQLKERFGSPYIRQWGWASAELNKSDPKFTDIEAAVGLDYLRPFFKLACQSNHAGSKGMLFDLGFPSNALAVMLAGPSDGGFYDPGVSTAISINQTTDALLGLRVTLTSLTTRLVVEKLAGLCDAKFGEAEQKYEHEFAQRQASQEK